MIVEVGLMAVYRIVSLAIAGVAVYVLFCERDWRQQLFSIIIFIPFALRAAGIK